MQVEFLARGGGEGRAQVGQVERGLELDFAVVGVGDGGGVREEGVGFHHGGGGGVVGMLSALVEE